MGDEWQLLSFKEAVQINPRVALERGKTYPFVEMKAIEPTQRGVSESEFRKFEGNGSRFIPWDTLMARITPCLENGKVARYVPSSGKDGPAFGSTEFIIIRGREGITDNDFVYYLTQWDNFRNFAISQMTGSSGRQRVPSDSLNSFIIPTPKIDEQRAIAHILGSLDDKIELNRQMNRTLEKIAQAIFQSWFVDFDPVIYNAAQAGNPVPERFEQTAAHYRDNIKSLHLPQHILSLFPDRFEDSEFGAIPKGWSVKSLFSLIELIGGGTPKTKVPEYWNGDIPWFSVVDAPDQSDVWVIKTEKYITQKGVENSSTKILPKGSTVISARGTVGKCALLGREMAMNQSCYGIRPEEGYSELYINFLLRTKINELQQSGHGSVFNTITRSTFEYIRVIDCGAGLSIAFDEIVRPYLEKILDNINENDAISQTRDLLLPKLISGDIRIENLDGLLGAS